MTSKWRFSHEALKADIDAQIGATISESANCKRRYCCSGKIESFSTNGQSIPVNDGAYFTLEGDSRDDYKITVPRGVDDATRGMLQAFGQILLDNKNGDQSFSKINSGGAGPTSSEFVR